MTVWYVARGAGLAALVLLTVSTALGALMSGRIPASPTARVVMHYVHRAVATTALAVLGLHLSMILADSFAHVSLVGALVPFRSAFRAFWVGLGTLAAYSFVLVASTGFLRRRMASSPSAARLWRSIHMSAYAGWGMAMLHGLRSGTDTAVPWVRWLYVACGAAVAASIAVRVASRGQRAVVRPAQHLAMSR
ncbi:MAG TPA: hypothetical protein VGN35_06070 [Jatrophihabitantaceae bacterium]|jgi:hypothetical protein|nr:hypothetical protein [Jatrophihabitantaceae bacterium]